MRKTSLILLAVITSISCLYLSTASAREGSAQHIRTEGIWGKIRYYTNHKITLENGQQYRFSKNVLIDVETLEKDDRGNVRILLDDSGRARKIFFNGIDMPDVHRRFKR